MGAFFPEIVIYSVVRLEILVTKCLSQSSAKCTLSSFGITKELDSSMLLCILLLTINDVLDWYPILFCLDDVNQRCLLEPMLGKVPNKLKFFMTFAISRRTE